MTVILHTFSVKECVLKCKQEESEKEFLKLIVVLLLQLRHIVIVCLCVYMLH